jgi:hypothetical protein
VFFMDWVIAILMVSAHLDAEVEHGAYRLILSVDSLVGRGVL